MRNIIRRIQILFRKLDDPAMFRSIVLFGGAILLLFVLISGLFREPTPLPQTFKEEMQMQGNQDVTVITIEEQTDTDDLEAQKKQLEDYLIDKYGSLEDVPEDVIIDVPGVYIGKTSEEDRIIDELNIDQLNRQKIKEREEHFD